MTTYETVLFKFNGDSEVLDTDLSLEEAQAFCKHGDSSSRTCMDKQRLASWGNDPKNPWFVGYREE